MVTIQDVARRAGVGVGTVSRVLNDSPAVSEATRRRVEAVITELDYLPSKHARGLSLGRTNALGVVVPFVTHLSSVERIRGVVRGCADSGYDVVLFDVETPGQRDHIVERLVRGDGVDGVLVVSLPPTPPLDRMIDAARVPVVMVDCRHPAVPHVYIDDRRGGRLATQALVDLGHRRIAFVGGVSRGPFSFTSDAHRLDGYEATLAAAGLPPTPDLVVDDAYDQDTARARTTTLLQRRSPPTAVFATSDRLALGVLQAVRESGRHVPSDISVIGFDDIELAAYAELSTVRQPLRDSGLEGAQLLLTALREGGGAASPVAHELTLELVLRSTTSPPPAAAGGPAPP